MRRAVLIRLALVAWFELGVVLFACSCGGDKDHSQIFGASSQLHEAEVRCGVTAISEPTIVQVKAVLCSRDGYVCCLPYANRYSSYYHTATNTIDLVSNTKPPQCAEYVVEHNLPCEMESAASFQATGVYVDRCSYPCS